MKKDTKAKNAEVNTKLPLDIAPTEIWEMFPRISKEELKKQKQIRDKDHYRVDNHVGNQIPMLVLNLCPLVTQREQPS